MSRSARVTLPFDEPRDFRLGIGELEELQERTDAGPEELLARIDLGRWRVSDIRHTLRLGLIGAGMQATEAAVLIDRRAGPGNLIEWKPLVRAIIQAALIGAPDEDDASSGETTGETTGSPIENSGSDASTR